MRRVVIPAAMLGLTLAACSSGSDSNSASPDSTGSPATGAAPSTSSSSGPATLPDWPGYHGTPDRAGNAATGPTGPLHRAWSTHLDGALYAQPLVGAGSILAATENNTVYALDPATGQIRWHRHLAEPASRADLPCGNIDPSGITGTPAYDATTHQLFVATEDHRARHTLVALDARNGSVRWQRSLDVLPNRDRYAEQQRAALLVTGGRVYVAFGGRAGDCGNYVGYVAAISTDGRGNALRYAVPTAREAGMWAPPGAVVGPGGAIYVASGNGAEVGGRYDGSDSVIRLSPTLTRTGLFAPSSWSDDNAQDLDLGSMSPVPVRDRIVIAGKRGTVFLLRADLGGVGSQVATLDGCAGFGGAAVHGNVVVLPCSDGIRALRVDGDRMRWLWQSGSLEGSPLIAGGAVYGFDGDNLVRADLGTGKRGDRVHVGEVTRFTTPVPAGHEIVVGTKSGNVVAVTGR